MYLSPTPPSPSALPAAQLIRPFRMHWKATTQTGIESEREREGERNGGWGSWRAECACQNKSVRDYIKRRIRTAQSQGSIHLHTPTHTPTHSHMHSNSYGKRESHTYIDVCRFGYRLRFRYSLILSARCACGNIPNGFARRQAHPTQTELYPGIPQILRSSGNTLPPVASISPSSFRCAKWWKVL